MKRDLLFLGGGVLLFTLSVVALAPRSVALQASRDSYAAQLAQRIQDLEARLRASLGTNQARHARLAGVHALQASQRVLKLQEKQIKELEGLPRVNDEVSVFLDGGTASWLGVEAHEVTSEKVKELKLPAERGVLVNSVAADSPAAKAGLKEKDVITEVNGQPVEGAMQFRRMIREVPAGRAVRLTVWRDGRAQTLTVTLGKAEEAHRAWIRQPGTFSYTMPDITIPEFPSTDFNTGVWMFPGAHARLGIDAEDLSGQLGTYFGAPDGEGILVRGVSSGSPAEKAGVKAGDVITSFNDERIRSVGELRQKLTAKRDEKSVKLGVLRNKAPLTLNVELPPAPERRPRTTAILHRTTI